MHVLCAMVQAKQIVRFALESARVRVLCASAPGFLITREIFSFALNATG
jgi:hypothetical protein